MPLKEYSGIGIDYGLLFTTNKSSEIYFTKDMKSLEKIASGEEGDYNDLYWDNRRKKLYFTRDAIYSHLSKSELHSLDLDADISEDTGFDSNADKIMAKSKYRVAGIFEFPNKKILSFPLENNLREKNSKRKKIAKYKNKLIVSLPEIGKIIDENGEIIFEDSLVGDIAVSRKELFHFGRNTKNPNGVELGIIKTLNGNLVFKESLNLGTKLCSDNNWLYIITGGTYQFTGRESRVYAIDKKGEASIVERNLRDKDECKRSGFLEYNKNLFANEYLTLFKGFHVVNTKKGRMAYFEYVKEGKKGDVGIIEKELDGQNKNFLSIKQNSIYASCDTLRENIASIISIPLEHIENLKNLVKKK